MVSASTKTCGEYLNETVGVVIVSSENVVLPLCLDHSPVDTAGIGGDGSNSTNTLIVSVPAVVVRGSKAVKYGNCSALSKLGLLDSSVVPGTNSDTNVDKLC